MVDEHFFFFRNLSLQTYHLLSTVQVICFYNLKYLIFINDLKIWKILIDFIDIYSFGVDLRKKKKFNNFRSLLYAHKLLFNILNYRLIFMVMLNLTLT